MARCDLVTFEKKLNELIPFSLAEKWDNVGLQVAGDNIKIKKVLLTLDFNQEVFEFARTRDINLIIAHHPLIFKPIPRLVAFQDYQQNLIRALLLSNIAFLALHTNLDKYFFDLISRELGLKAIRSLTQEGYGSYGHLAKKIPLADFISLLKKKLKIKHLAYIGDEGRPISAVASIGGSGGSFIQGTLTEKKIDVLFTSDVRYHSAQLAREMGLALIQASHYDTENLMLPALKKVLEKKFRNGIHFELNQYRTDPVKYN